MKSLYNLLQGLKIQSTYYATRIGEHRCLHLVMGQHALACEVSLAKALCATALKVRNGSNDKAEINPSVNILSSLEKDGSHLEWTSVESLRDSLRQGP